MDLLLNNMTEKKKEDRNDDSIWQFQKIVTLKGNENYVPCINYETLSNITG